MSIEQFDETINACRGCFMCRHACTVGRALNHESETPRGRALLLLRVRQGLMELDDEVMPPIDTCCQCGACKSWCEGNYDMPGLVRAARADRVAAGNATPEALAIREEILSTGNLFGLPRAGRHSSTPQPAEVLYFAGCYATHKEQAVADAFTSILDAADVTHTSLSEETCCGKPLSLLGFSDDARSNAMALCEKIRATGCTTLVTTCPSCYDAFTVDYPALGVSLAPEIQVIHAVDYVATLIEEGRLVPQKSLDIKVTYHDDDYLGRYHKLHDAPRRILTSIPGITLVEMQWNRDKAFSAGEAGGIMAQLHPDIAVKVDDLLMEEAQSTGASVMAVACPISRNMLRTSESTLTVSDVLELVAASVEADAKTNTMLVGERK